MFPLARQPRAGGLGAGLETGWSGAGSPGERQLPGTRVWALRCSLRLGLGLPWPGIVGSAVRSPVVRRQAGRPSEPAESRLFPARRLPPTLLPCGRAPRCPLTVWPLPPSTATAPGTPSSNTSRRVRAPATRTSASVPSLTLPFTLECLPSLRRPWLPGTTTHLSPAPRRPPPPRKAAPRTLPSPRLPPHFVNASPWHPAPVFHLFTCLSPLLDCESLRAWTVSYASLCFCA